MEVKPRRQIHSLPPPQGEGWGEGETPLRNPLSRNQPLPPPQVEGWSEGETPQGDPLSLRERVRVRASLLYLQACRTPEPECSTPLRNYLESCTAPKPCYGPQPSFPRKRESSGTFW